MALVIISNGNVKQAFLGSATYGSVPGATQDIITQIGAIQTTAGTDPATLIMSNFQTNVIQSGGLANDYYCTCLVTWTTQ